MPPEELHQRILNDLENLAASCPENIEQLGDHTIAARDRLREVGIDATPSQALDAARELRQHAMDLPSCDELINNWAGLAIDSGLENATDEYIERLRELDRSADRQRRLGRRF